MNNEIEQKEIKEISTWDLPDTVMKPDGYDRKTLPEPTAQNMLIYMNKINELVAVVNKLERMNKGLSVCDKCKKGEPYADTPLCKECLLDIYDKQTVL